MPVILLADKNSTWLEKHRQSIIAIEKHGWIVKSVGLDSSGILPTATDSEIYEIAAKEGWFIVTRDIDFFEVAYTARSRNLPITHVLHVPDYLNIAELIFKAIEQILAGGSLGEFAEDGISKVEYYLDSDAASYIEASKAVAIAISKNKAPPQDKLDIMKAYSASQNIDFAAESEWLRQQRLQRKTIDVEDTPLINNPVPPFMSSSQHKQPTSTNSRSAEDTSSSRTCPRCKRYKSPKAKLCRSCHNETR